MSKHGKTCFAHYLIFKIIEFIKLLSRNGLFIRKGGLRSLETLNSEINILTNMTKKQFLEKALRILRILNTVMTLVNWIF